MYANFEKIKKKRISRILHFSTFLLTKIRHEKDLKRSHCRRYFNRFYILRINSTILRNPNFVVENTKSQETMFLHFGETRKFNHFYVTINSSIFLYNSNTLLHRAKRKIVRDTIFSIHQKITIKQLFIRQNSRE